MDDARPTLDPDELLGQAGRLRAIARQLVGDGHAAEDLVQDTWVATLEARRGLSPSCAEASSWRAWLAGVTRNLSRRRLRRDTHRRALERAVARPEASGELQDLAERMQLQQELAESILELPEPQRSALVMRYLDGLEYEAIARRQQCSPANARQRVSRALGMLRARMGGASGSAAWLGGLMSVVGQLPGRVRALLGDSPSMSGTAGAGVPVGAGVTLMGIKTSVVAAATLATIVLVATRTREPLPELALESTQTGASELELDPGDPGAGAQALSSRPSSVAPPGRAAASPARAADALVPLRGRVTDASGMPLAEVQIRWLGSPEGEPEVHASELDAEGLVGASSECWSDVDGEYTLLREPGAESVRFLRGGFLPAIHEMPAGNELDVVLARCPRLHGLVRAPGGGAVRPPGEVRLDIREPGREELRSMKTELDADGRYSFEELPLGRIVSMRARARGFDKVEQQLELELVAEASLLHDLELRHGLTVVGTVRDAETLEPIPFARVWCNEFDYEEDGISATTIADAEGHFRLEGIERDENVHERLRFHTLRLMGSSEGHTASPLKAIAIVPDEVGLAHHDLHLVPRACSLRIVLLEPGRERPAQGMFVWIVDSEMNFQHQSSNRHGEIELKGFPAGRLALVAYELEREPDGGHHSLSVELELSVGGPQRIELELEDAIDTRLEGQLVDSAGQPVAGVEVLADYDLHFGGLRIELDSEAATTDEAGHYRFERVRAGHYRVKVAGCSQPEVHPLRLESGEQRTSLDFVVDACMRVRGLVDRGEHAPDSFVVQLLASGSPEVVSEARLEGDDSFAMEEVLAGSYELVLLREQAEVDRASVDFGRHEGILLRAP